MTTLDLSNKGLLVVPNLEQCSNITTLNLFNNKLTFLPENLPDTIEILNVQQNQLTVLPLKLPKNIKKIYACHNSINIFPKNLNNIMIDISYNRLPATEKTFTRGKGMTIFWNNQNFKYGTTIIYKDSKYYYETHKNKLKKVIKEIFIMRKFSKIFQHCN